MKNWYIVQSHSNFENKVAKLIKEEAEKNNVSDKIDEIVVPTHDITEVKRGKRVQRKKKYFPGYVLIKSEMNNELYHMIKNIKKVSGFLGTKGMAIPVSDKEHVATYGLSILAKEQLIASKYAKEAIKKYKIDTNKPIPTKL